MAANAGCEGSVTSTATRDIPALSGRPEMTPVDRTRDSPAGSLPETILHAYGDLPPIAASLAE